MNITIEASYQSLNKYQEELCGDKVEIIKTDTSTILILADGMGSGVKANILATLTSKILGTMLKHGATLEDCVETIAKTLPVCQTRQIAYSTFSILQIFHHGEAYLVEFDNPSCIFLRDGNILSIPYEEKEISNKRIREYRFSVHLKDYFILMSDGAIHAGVGNTLNFGWTWESIASYAKQIHNTHLSALRLSTYLVKACDDLYVNLPGDDTTIAVARIIEKKSVHLLTGPPLVPDLDEIMIRDFIRQDGLKIISGGTTAKIASNILEKELITSLEYTDSNLPPTAIMEGIDLVTEGVLTLSRTLSLLKEYEKDDINYDFFQRLDENNGASKIAKYIIEECTTLYMYVGMAINPAHQNPSLPYDLNLRLHLIEQLEDTTKKIGKEVHIKYY